MSYILAGLGFWLLLLLHVHVYIIMSMYGALVYTWQSLQNLCRGACILPYITDGACIKLKPCSLTIECYSLSGLSCCHAHVCGGGDSIYKYNII